MLSYDYVDGWCAGCKVSGITETTITHKNFPSLEKIMRNAVDHVEASCILISVNQHETRVLEWLKKNKFTKGPVVYNWHHGGHKTWVFFKRIPKKIYNEETNGDATWF